MNYRMMLAMSYRDIQKIYTLATEVIRTQIKSTSSIDPIACNIKFLNENNILGEASKRKINSSLMSDVHLSSKKRKSINNFKQFLTILKMGSK